ncbi:hypothetical protein RQP46_002941 [Phenoliferia psychrophenolica]
MPSLYEITVPVFEWHLKTLSTLLGKAATQLPSATEQSALLDARLVDGMCRLPFQVKRACYLASEVAYEVAGLDPGLDRVQARDNDTSTIEELQALIAKTIARLGTVKEEMLAGKEQVPVSVITPRGDFHYTATSYLLTWITPNFYFHYVTAYDLLRSQGVQIGKIDYLGLVAQK